MKVMRLRRRYVETMFCFRYGDLSPKSVFGRIFSMLWISLGVILISLFTGLVSAALNQTANSELDLAGTEVSNYLSNNT